MLPYLSQSIDTPSADEMNLSAHPSWLIWVSYTLLRRASLSCASSFSSHVDEVFKDDVPTSDRLKFNAFRSISSFSLFFCLLLLLLRRFFFALSSVTPCCRLPRVSIFLLGHRRLLCHLGWPGSRKQSCCQSLHLLAFPKDQAASFFTNHDR